MTNSGKRSFLRRLQRRSRDEAALANPARRALALFRLDLRTEAVREVGWTLRAMEDRELLAAADLARKNDIYDRRSIRRTRLATNTTTLCATSPVRRPHPPAARNQSLDDAWVYGPMRQESRFIVTAKSNVGASGLMQLMPATARWVAGRSGSRITATAGERHRDQRPAGNQLHAHGARKTSTTNRCSFASAAYNAGPGRARKWRADVPLEGAIYAETIPFNETRDYVKKVMSNSGSITPALFSGNPTPGKRGWASSDRGSRCAERTPTLTRRIRSTEPARCGTGRL